MVAPAVFGSEYSGYESEEAAETVFVLSERLGPQDREARVELRKDEAERLVILAYTSLELLVECCGETQPWIGVGLPDVSRVQNECGAETVLWDVPLPSGSRQTASAEGNES
ncbi:SAV_915 family protein [Saccharopolyspora sp. NPDC002686]|uniref:SAV_915 family protein n=1 Tax=Saccharopolyspora sp. NPDC002686 TaxID=3154541 RepID=UPI00331DE6D8